MAPAVGSTLKTLVDMEPGFVCERLAMLLRNTTSNEKKEINVGLTPK